MNEKEIDFRNGRRGAIVRVPKGKTRITIRIDDDILEHFREHVEAAGTGNYQSMINQALRQLLDEQPANEAVMSKLNDIERLLRNDAAPLRRKAPIATQPDERYLRRDARSRSRAVVGAQASAKSAKKK